MLRLNLLPWRERQRAWALRRLRATVIAAATLALCAVVLMDQLARHRAQQQADANAALQQAISALNEQIEQFGRIRQNTETLRAQAAALAALRTGQGQVSGLFADLEHAVPEGIQLVELALERGRLQIEGVAASSAAVAQFMRNLDRSGVLAGLELKRITSSASGDEFLLLARMSAPWS
ncbi:PilN domain-containing protein [Pseudomonas sp. PSKL.D1]|uniref:PilN domain-containing protein n=1 Tax=Pseudomonas sp. PSKL.D1 TaxID=3029060 RepID=UPI002380CBED|nr:PilN domain-containing protein [Pseudomonas sp. PSKL.D1]WDY60540.1 PilN domain-containing protein [Pseudomonas sp. PSKL.D1]